MDEARLVVRLLEASRVPQYALPLFERGTVERVHWLEPKPNAAVPRPLWRCYVVMECGDVDERGQVITTGFTIAHYAAGTGPAALEHTRDILAAQGEFPSKCVRLLPARQHAIDVHDECDLLLIELPLDCQLPQLRMLLSAPAMHTRLVRSAGVVFESTRSPVIDGFKVDVVRYQPENRCTLRYSWRAARSELVTPDDYRSTTRLFAKTFRDDASDIYQRLHQLYQASTTTGIGFRVPKVLAYDAQLNTIWFEEVCGAPCLDNDGVVDWRTLLARTAQCLATLHHSSLPDLPTLDDQRFVKQATRYGTKILARSPHLSEHVAHELERIRATCPASPSTRLCPVHGGLRFSQIWKSPDALYALDLDDVALGRPELDLATLLLDLQGRITHPDEAADLAEFFLREYLSHDDDVTIDRPALDWFLATQRLKQQTWRSRRGD
ncbi:MAG: hypothetical protein KDB23_11775 [Planctomycetales bacterium]|nr:hypothetical protein [Planctomycetales bacterium]